MIGSKIIRLTETSSTNTYAAKLLMAEKPEEGTIIFSDSQTQGRGQQGNTWESESGKNLILSIILYPNSVKPEKQFILNKFISLAVFDFVKLHIPANMSLKIKWPNDIYVNDQKIAGILIENSIIGNIFEHVIIGIGININQEKFSAQVSNPVSLRQITGKDYELDECLIELCGTLNNRYDQMPKIFRHTLDTEYLINNYKYKVYTKFKKNDSFFMAKISGISEFGKLQLQDIEGNLSEYSYKEIEYVI